MTCHLHAGRKSLDITMSMKIDFVLVWVVQIDLISVWGIEFDLISVKGRNLLGFSVGVKNDLVLVF